MHYAEAALLTADVEARMEKAAQELGDHLKDPPLWGEVGSFIVQQVDMSMLSVDNEPEFIVVTDGGGRQPWENPATVYVKKVNQKSFHLASVTDARTFVVYVDAIGRIDSVEENNAEPHSGKRHLHTKGCVPGLQRQQVYFEKVRALKKNKDLLYKELQQAKINENIAWMRENHPSIFTQECVGAENGTQVFSIGITTRRNHFALAAIAVKEFKFETDSSDEAPMWNAQVSMVTTCGHGSGSGTQYDHLGLTLHEFLAQLMYDVWAD